MPYLYERIREAIANGTQTRAGLEAAFPRVSVGSMGSAIRRLKELDQIDRLGRGFYTIKGKPREKKKRGPPLPDQIIARVRKVRPLTARELSLCLDVKRSKVSDALTDMVESGLVTWEPGGLVELIDEEDDE